MASTNRSSSASDSDSVGSTMSVPATGKLMVGAWKPKSMSRLATSSTVTPVAWRDRPQVEDALVGDPVVVAGVEHGIGGIQAGGNVVGVEDGQLGGPRAARPDP